MITLEIQATSASQSTPAPAPAPAAPPSPAPTAAGSGHGFSFHDFLSAMNPLQYVPVVGTIYRALTGDTIPEALRGGGSMLISGLLGGPIGLLTNFAITIGEKITGIDPEKIVAAYFSKPAAAAALPADTSTSAASSIRSDRVAPVAGEQGAGGPVAGEQGAGGPVAGGPVAGEAIPARVALNADQLAAYGIRLASGGSRTFGDTGEADVLNGIELARLGKVAVAAYAANQPKPFSISPAPQTAPLAM